MDSVSSRIRARAHQRQAQFFANDSIAHLLEPGELEQLEAEVRAKIEGVLESLVIDVENDHNSRETAARVAKLYVREVFAGRYVDRPKVTSFPNVKKLDELYTVGPIQVRSACSHHLCPVEGDLWVGVVPGDKLIGLSKFSRLVRWVTARPQIQEEAVVQVADLLEELITPRGLAVVMKARHTCMTWRGVQEHDTSMTTAVVRGIMKDESITRDEFYRIIQAQGFTCRSA